MFYIQVAKLVDALAAAQSERAELAADLHTREAKLTAVEDAIVQAQAAAQDHCRSPSSYAELCTPNVTLSTLGTSYNSRILCTNMKLLWHLYALGPGPVEIVLQI